MSDSGFPPRPPTPQALLHRQPDKPAETSIMTTKPAKYIVLITASTGVVGKVQIARAVADSLSCPLYQGGSLHESSAKAASVGASRAGVGDSDVSGSSGANQARYQRMWLSKMTRTGLLFPEESRPATEGFFGFGGASSSLTPSTSRRGSVSSVASESSQSSKPASQPVTASFAPKATNTLFALSEEERLRRANPALMVLTHPALEQWHRLAIRNSIKEYGIGVIFVPLDEDGDDEDLPVLQPLDPRTMTSFPLSFGDRKTKRSGDLDTEMMVSVDLDGDVEAQTREIIDGVKEFYGR
ncbi:hypothetical protein B0H66DRAFT_570010 [Apodospora peruviana]|uniref:Uncharacterized protein n=1 Tax=Apodospora peruviana TaxID=516989 RepID=A0AAE0HT05_9PEZI|nr:hypothetical protein B0H66DRAFT_570010 [Apodospora peruviana]